MNSRSYQMLASILLLFFLSDISFPQQSPEIKNLPPVNQTRSQTIDLKHIEIDLRFDWAKKQAYGTAALTLSPVNPTDKITLDAGFLTINSASTQNGIPLKFEYDGGDKNDNLRITLERVYAAGEAITVKIDYRTNWVNQPDPNSLGGTNGKGIRFTEPTSNDPNKMREIWSMGEPESNRYWFPSYDSPNDFRTTEFTATVDKKLTVISNGRLVETKDNADGTRTFHWKTDTPYANFLTSFVIGEFVDVKQNYQDIELHNFGYPHEKEWVAASVERLPDMVKFFSEKIGVKYPYPSYSQVFVQDIGSFTSNMNVSTITENMVDDYPTHADFFYLWDLTEAEALAQQWFGNYLTSRDWSDVWLNKSFAHYFNCLYNEHKNGREEWLLWVHSFDQSAYLFDWNSGNRRPIITQNYENALSFISDNYSTIRGALVLNMLRKHLGEENWWKAIRHYVKSNANKAVTTEDFRKAVEETAGVSMNWFFEQWLYKMGHPIFEVTKLYDETKKELTLNVKQIQKIDSNNAYPQVEFFQGKVEIEIDDKIKQVWLEPKGENVFTFASSNPPKLVNFDFESAWIKELRFEKSFDELLYQFQNDKDVLGKIWAMRELVKIAKDEKTSPEDKAKVQASLRNTVLGKGYWRLRLAAMSQLQGLLAPSWETKPVPLDEATIAMLLTVIKNDKSWVRASAIGFLGMTRDSKYAALYLNALDDQSFRVINSAAIALGKSKAAKAFDTLAKLKDKPSMKSQSLISALLGLKELGDPRGFDIAFKALSDLNLPRWRLPNPPVWDYRVFAADTIATLGKSDKAYPLIFERFKKSMSETDIDGIFYNVVLITTLADPRGQEAFEMLKAKFKNDANVMQAVNQYEMQFKNAIKKS
jgi:aminopeptidase N